MGSDGELRDDVEVTGGADQPGGAVLDAGSDAAANAAGEPVDASQVHEPDWWHREHPTFVALVSFYIGVLTIIIVPALWGAGLRAVVGADEAERLFGWILVVFAFPVVLLVVRRTRRVGAYMLLGMVLCASVVVGVAAAVLWVLMR